jgi:hypothetical protein
MILAGKGIGSTRGTYKVSGLPTELLDTHTLYNQLIIEAWLLPLSNTLTVYREGSNIYNRELHLDAVSPDLSRG